MTLAGGATLLAVLAILGSTGFASAHALPAVRAPFPGHVATVNASNSTSCARGRVVQAAHFNLTTGQGGLDDQTKASYGAAASTNPSSTVEAQAYSRFELWMKFVAPSTASHTITATFSVKASWGESVSAMACKAAAGVSYRCAEYETDFLGACGVLWDVTTGVFTIPACGLLVTNYSYFDVSCPSSGSCTNSSIGGSAAGSVHGNYKVIFTANMVHTDRYVLELYVNGEATSLLTTAGTTFRGSPSGSACANVDSNAPTGDHANLVSIVVT